MLKEIADIEKDIDKKIKQMKVANSTLLARKANTLKFLENSGWGEAKAPVPLEMPTFLKNLGR